MTSPCLARRVRALLGGLGAALLLAAAAPAVAAPAAPAAPVADSPKLRAFGADASGLLTRAQAAIKEHNLTGARRPLELLVDNFDGTPEAVVGSLLLLEVLADQWTDRSASPEQTIEARDALTRRALQIGRSESYRHPAAGVLRRYVLYFALENRSPFWWSGQEPTRVPRDLAHSCAGRYLDVLSWLAPGDEQFPNILINAAQCFEWVAMWPEAMQYAQRVLAEFPRHAAARRALTMLLRVNLGLARFADAAQLAERYAQQYPHAADAPDLLADAYQLRRGLGQQAAALADLERIETTAWRGEPERADELLQVRLEPMSDDQRLAHLEHYLRRHDWHLAPDRRVVLEARIAGLRWKLACKTGLHHDLCITTPRPVDSAHAPAPRCVSGSATTPTTVQPRDPKAAGSLRRIARLSFPSRPFRHLEREQERRREFADAVAMAAVLAADQRLEAWLEARSASALPQQHRRSDALARQLESTYGDIAARPDSPQASIAALARLGQLAEVQADAPVGSEQATNHCEAAPLVERAISAYTRCLDRSVATGVYTEFSRLCEAALTTHAPRRFAPLHEQFGVAGQQPALAREPRALGVQLELPRAK